MPRCSENFCPYIPSCSATFSFVRPRVSFAPRRLSAIGLYVPRSTTALGFGQRHGPCIPNYFSAVGLYGSNCIEAFGFGRPYGPHGIAARQPSAPTALSARQPSAPSSLAAWQPSSSTGPSANVPPLHVSVRPIWHGPNITVTFGFGQPHRRCGCQPSAYMV